MRGRGIFHWSEEKTFQAVAQQVCSCVLLELRLKFSLKHQKWTKVLGIPLLCFKNWYFHNSLILPERCVYSWFEDVFATTSLHITQWSRES